MNCPSCGNTNPENALYCNLCQASFVKPKQEPRVTTYQPGRIVTPDTAPIVKLNWFQRHLNVTFLLPISLVILAGFLTGTLGYNELDILVVSEAMIAAVYLLTFILGMWYIHRKNRIFPWLLLLFLPPAAWVVFVCLENRNSENRYTDYRPGGVDTLASRSKYGY